MSQSPLIWIERSDYSRLAMLVAGPGRFNPEVSAFLQAELERAIICQEEQLPPAVVRMGSRVLYRRDGQTVPDWGVLVYPSEPYAQGNISISSPLGAAMIGLQEGTSMAYRDDTGLVRRLTVERVHPS